MSFAKPLYRFARPAAPLLAVLCLAAFALGPLSEQARSAPSSAELREKLEAAKAEAVELRETLVAARRHMFEAEAEADRAATQLAEMEDRLAAGARRTAFLERRVEQADRRLADERARLRRARAVLAERLVAIYLAGPTGGDELAVGLAGFDDFLVGAEYMAAIHSADARLADRVEAVRASVAAERERLRAERSAARRHEEALRRDRDRIGAVALAAEARAAELREAAAARDAALSELMSRMDRWAEQVKRAERREARAAESAAGEVERWLGGPYSIPTAIVMCESGGDYGALNPSSGAGGAYQIMPETWRAYGGRGLPHLAPKAEQDRIAAQIWADSGPSAWVCKA